jgi:hypothetical protein
VGAGGRLVSTSFSSVYFYQPSILVTMFILSLVFTIPAYSEPDASYHPQIRPAWTPQFRQVAWTEEQADRKWKPMPYSVAAWRDSSATSMRPQMAHWLVDTNYLIGMTKAEVDAVLVDEKNAAFGNEEGARRFQTYPIYNVGCGHMGHPQVDVCFAHGKAVCCRFTLITFDKRFVGDWSPRSMQSLETPSRN